MAPPTPKYIQICCFGEADSWPSTKRPFYLSCAKTSVFGTTAVKLTATQMYFTLNFQPTEATFVFLFVLKRLNVKQVSTRECIPVECVPPAPVAVGGSPPGTPRNQTPQTRPPGTRYPPDQTLQDQAPPGTRHPPQTRPPRTRYPPGPGPPWDQAPPRTRHLPGPGTPPVDRHTLVNILPCPKLRLRAVINLLSILNMLKDLANTWRADVLLVGRKVT